MNVPARDCDRTMSGDPRHCPSIAPRFAQARQEWVPEGVEDEWADTRRLISLGLWLRFNCVLSVLQQGRVDHAECARVLFLQARVIDVAALSESGPHPALSPHDLFPTRF